MSGVHSGQRRMIMVGGASLLALTLGAGQAADQGTGSVYRIPVDGVIELGLAPFVERSLKEAQLAGARAVVLDINTPGGRVDAAERIADAIVESSIPVYAFVNRQAYSAGALISLATDHIYLRPGSVIGAATPIVGSGEKAPEKIVSAMRSKMRALAELRGLDPEIAEAMVDEEIGIEGVIESGKLLTLTALEAEGLGFGTVVEDFDALLSHAGMQGSPITVTKVNWAERLVRLFSHPVLSPFLLTLGFLGLVAEVKSPGFGVAGAAGMLALALFFGSHLLIGLAGWEDLLIFSAGVALLAVEAFFIPGFGFFGILGGVGVLGGIYLAVLGTLPTVSDFARAGSVLSSTLLLVLISAWALLRYLPRSERLNRSGVFLRASTSREDGWESAERRLDLVGKHGQAITDLRPSGVGLFGDERVDVVSESEWVEAGTAIEVVSAEGYRHVVRALGPSGLLSSSDTDATNG